MTDTNQQDEKISSLYTKAGDAVPPASLDETILAASRHETGSRSRSIPAKPDYWHLPAALASLAAVVVLSLLIVPLMLEETQREEAAGYSPARTDNFEVMEEKLPDPGVSSPALPESAPMLDQVGKEFSVPMKAKQQAESRALRKREAPETEEDAMLSEPAGIAADEETRLPADQWMESILQLVEKGDYRQADKELELFRSVYPEFSVDESLTSTLKRKIQPTTPVPGAVK